MPRRILNIIEEVTIKGKKILAKIDTGAFRCSIDKELAKELKLGPVIKNKKVRSANGRTTRSIVEAEITLKGEKIKTTMNLADRSHMKYPLLIGRNVLKDKFLVKI